MHKLLCIHSLHAFKHTYTYQEVHAVRCLFICPEAVTWLVIDDEKNDRRLPPWPVSKVAVPIGDADAPKGGHGKIILNLDHWLMRPDRLKLHQLKP